MAVLGGVAWFYFGGGWEQVTNKQVAAVDNQVADQFLQEYRMTLKSGSRLDQCVAAGQAKAGYLAAHDDANYEKFVQIERGLCK